MFEILEKYQSRTSILVNLQAYSLHLYFKDELFHRYFSRTLIKNFWIPIFPSNYLLPSRKIPHKLFKSFFRTAKRDCKIDEAELLTESVQKNFFRQRHI